MTSTAIELFDLIARWVHVIAGIMWVGNSMLFNWLDRNLRSRAEPDIYGDIWLIHSGGFYLVEKNKGEHAADGARRLPTPLHWFKWQAYTTWLTGAVLLVIVYYLGGRALITDPAVRSITTTTGMTIALATVVGGWALYEILWRTVGARWPAVAGAVSLILLVDAVVLLTATLSGRAAYLHIGSMLGTIMAGNVALTIMPSQRELVAALSAGRESSQVIADRAKTRSIHNNYITFPVIALMLSAHFPSLYAAGGTRAALPLLTLIASGAAVRHVMNIRITFAHWRPALAAVVVVALTLLKVELGLTPWQGAGASLGDNTVVPDVVTFADVRRIIDRRCAACHSQTPSDVSLGFMPAGVSYDTPEQIQAFAPRIKERATVAKTMPPGNKTRITDTERAILARWIELGAVIDSSPKTAAKRAPR